MRTMVSPEEFVRIMEAKGYEISDASEGLDDFDYVLLAKGDNYQIEFYQATSVGAAQEVVERVEVTAELNRGNIYRRRSASGFNFSRFQESSNTGFSMAHRLDQSVLSAFGEIEARERIEEIIDYLESQ